VSGGVKQNTEWAGRLAFPKDARRFKNAIGSKASRDPRRERVARGAPLSGRAKQTVGYFPSFLSNSRSLYVAYISQ